MKKGLLFVLLIVLSGCKGVTEVTINPILDQDNNEVDDYDGMVEHFSNLYNGVEEILEEAYSASSEVSAQNYTYAQYTNLSREDIALRDDTLFRLEAPVSDVYNDLGVFASIPQLYDNHEIEEGDTIEVLYKETKSFFNDNYGFYEVIEDDGESRQYSSLRVAIEDTSIYYERMEKHTEENSTYIDYRYIDSNDKVLFINLVDNEEITTLHFSNYSVVDQVYEVISYTINTLDDEVIMYYNIIDYKAGIGYSKSDNNNQTDLSVSLYDDNNHFELAYTVSSLETYRLSYNITALDGWNRVWNGGLYYNQALILDLGMSDSSIAALLGYNISQSKTLEVEPSDTDLKFAFQNLTYTNHTWDEIKSLYDAKDEYLNNVIFSDDGFTKDGETYEFDSLIDFVNDYLPEIYQ